jgi:hypothetical protein
MATLLRHRWALAWAGLTLAFALHVFDEATHDFLGWYNPTALRFQAVLGGVPFPPVFSFATWLGGLCAVVVLLALLTPFVQPGRRWLLIAAYLYAVVHTANALGHLAVSASGRWLAPGVLSSPLLLATALWLIYETHRVQQATRRKLATPAQPER